MSWFWSLVALSVNERICTVVYQNLKSSVLQYILIINYWFWNTFLLSHPWRSTSPIYFFIPLLKTCNFIQSLNRFPELAPRFLTARLSISPNVTLAELTPQNSWSGLVSSYKSTAVGCRLASLTEINKKISALSQQQATKNPEACQTQQRRLRRDVLLFWHVTNNISEWAHSPLWLWISTM